eukprot:1484479-Rhodomonas_salina.2
MRRARRTSFGTCSTVLYHDGRTFFGLDRTSALCLEFDLFSEGGSWALSTAMAFDWPDTTGLGLETCVKCVCWTDCCWTLLILLRGGSDQAPPSPLLRAGFTRRAFTRPENARHYAGEEGQKEDKGEAAGPTEPSGNGGARGRAAPRDSRAAGNATESAENQYSHSDASMG